jgi:hypothetical protein
VACPRFACTVLISSPSCREVTAQVCLRSWNRASGLAIFPAVRLKWWRIAFAYSYPILALQHFFAFYMAKLIV